MKTLRNSILILSAVTGVAFADHHTTAPVHSLFKEPYVAPVTAAHQEIASLLKDVNSDALKVRFHAGVLGSMARHSANRYSWQTHADELTMVGEFVNRQARTLNRLKELREQATPWQQQVIDRIEPMLSMIAYKTNVSIDRLNANRKHTMKADYRQAVETIYSSADQASSLIEAKFDYVEARRKLERASTLVASK